MCELSIRKTSRGVAFVAKVVPGSSRTGVAGVLDGMLKVKISAAPEKGRANQSLVGFLADRLGVKKNAVSIVSGSRKPTKQIEVRGITPEMLLDRLNLNKQDGSQ